MANRSANQFARATADSYLLAPSGGRPPIETANDIFDQFASEIEHSSGTHARSDQLVDEALDPKHQAMLDLSQTRGRLSRKLADAELTRADASSK